MLTLWNSGIPGPNSLALEELRGQVRRSWKLFSIHATASVAAVMASVIEIGGVALLPPTHIT